MPQIWPQFGILSDRFVMSNPWLLIVLYVGTGVAILAFAAVVVGIGIGVAEEPVSDWEAVEATVFLIIPMLVHLITMGTGTCAALRSPSPFSLTHPVAEMTPTNPETTAGRGGSGDGLPGSTVVAPVQGVLGGIAARQRPDVLSGDSNGCLSIPGIVIESWEGPRWWWA